MAELTINGKKGFVSWDMQSGFYPKYSTVVAPFSNGKAVVLNDKNEEIYINKVGNYLGYTEKQNLIFEQKRLAEEERIRVAEENEKRKIKEEFAAIEFSKDEIKFLTFYSKYKDSKYQFAKEKAELSYTLALLISVEYRKPFKDAILYNPSEGSLVKIILKTIDGSPIALKQKDVFDFLDNIHSKELTLLGYSNKDKLFYGIRKPVSYMDKMVINANWYRQGVQKDGSWFVESSGFSKFAERMETFALYNGLKVEYCKYLGSYYDDLEGTTYQSYLTMECDICNLDYYKDDTSDIFFESIGEIIMESGDSYRWNYEKDGGYWISDGWFGSKKYPTFQSLINALESKCRDKYCR